MSCYKVQIHPFSLYLFMLFSPSLSVSSLFFLSSHIDYIIDLLAPSIVVSATFVFQGIYMNIISFVFICFILYDCYLFYSL